MRICHIGNINTIHLQNIMNHLQQAGHENHLLSLSEPISEERQKSLDAGIEWSFVGPLSQQSFLSRQFWQTRFLAAKRVQQKIRQLRPDVVHAYYLTDAGLLGAFADYHPYVLQAIGSDILLDYAGNALKKKAINYTLKTADLVLCYSKQIREILQSQRKIQNKVRFFSNGIDLNRFKKQTANPELLKKLDLSAEHKVIMSLRNFESVYNLECLIEAVPQIIAREPQARFILLGEGRLKQKLLAQAKTLGVMNYLRFQEPVPNAQLPGFINLAKVYVSTALSDGMSFALLEAMGCELPVVVSDIPANQAIIRENENGLFFPIKNPDALAEQVIKLLQPSEMAESMGKQNREVILKSYNFQKFMDQIILAFEQVRNGKASC